MNHRKWKTKFEHKDSRRFLKRHAPYYGDPYHRGSMPPSRFWLAQAKGFVRRYPQNLAHQEEERNNPPSRFTTEGRGIWLATNIAQQEIDAVDAAIRETLDGKRGQECMEYIRRVYWENQDRKAVRYAMRINVETAQDWEFRFLRAAAYHIGIHFNHTGRNRFGYSRRKNGGR